MPDPSVRYKIETIEIADDLATIIVSFVDPTKQGGPVQERTQQVIDCVDLGVREKVWDVLESLCDIIDEAHQARRIHLQGR